MQPTKDGGKVAPTALAGLLEKGKDALLEKWAGRVLRDPKVPSAAPLSHLALYDHYPAIVDRIVATLRTVAEHAEALGATMATTEEAQGHVRDRVQAAYSAPEVLRELSHLRLAILDLCEDAGILPDRASSTILHAAFDHMMIQAADDLSRLELDARRRAEALARERADLYEKERRGREELEEAHRAKDQFLAMVSHELRTPLNAIAGWSQMLACNENDGAMRARAVASIQRNAKAQSHLIDSVLDITRLTSGGVSIEGAPIDVAQLLRNTMESFNPALRDKQITVEADLPDVAPPVLGDEQRMRQIFTNLLGNAMKFTPAGGTVRVSLKGDAEKLRVEISDSGIGISPGFLPHVFEPFLQADPSWARQHGGLGLGLAISKALVELHGGTIEASSAGLGAGATFGVTLPLATSGQLSEPPFSASAPTATERRLHGLRVLVVDDEADARELVGAMLERSGAAVDLASSGPEALAAARRQPPDVVISDLAMPGMDGLRLVERLRQQSMDVPAVALSAFTTPQAVAASKAAGFRAHVAKPVVLTELLEAVGEAAAQSPRRAQGTTARRSPSSGREAARSEERSVLIVDDDRAIAIELADLLRDEGFAVHVASDGADAWRELECGLRPSVIVLDLLMPVMDGWTLRRKLLDAPRFASIPVVVLTGVTAVDGAAIEGVGEVIRKPFDFQALLTAVDRHSAPTDAE